MGLSAREFENRLKKICPRWYLKARSLTVVSGGQARSFDEPIQVWEKPYAKGVGFETDTLVMEIKGPISLLHLNKLRQGHWYRTQELQKSIFEACREETREREKVVSNLTSYETKQFAYEHRRIFREASRRAGFSRSSIHYDGFGEN